MSEEWSFVKKKRNNNGTQQTGGGPNQKLEVQKQWARDASMAISSSSGSNEVSAEVIIESIRQKATMLRETAFYKLILSSFCSSSGSGEHGFTSIISLGIGNFSVYPSSLLQITLALCLKEDLLLVGTGQ